MNLVILLTVLGAVAYRISSPAERARYFGVALEVWREIKEAATRRTPASEAFHAALRARARLPIATWTIAAISVLVGVAVAFAPAPGGETLVSWGANIGPRTTNGEWWRLLTAIFLPAGLMHLACIAAVLMHAGAALERLVGRWAFAAVYLASGVFAGLVNISSRPVDVTLSGSGALFGLYGLLVAALAWQKVVPAKAADGQAAPSTAQIPFIAIKRLGGVGILFGLYTAVSGSLTSAELAGFGVGLMYGLVVGWRVTDRLPATRLVGATAAGVLVAAVASAMPLRNIADVKPEITRVVAAEERTAARYRAAFEAFKKGKINAEALAQVAERSNVTELQTVDARLSALRNVPAEHQGIVADAREYLTLRTKSWRARAEVIRRTSPDPRRGQQNADADARLQAETKFRADMMARGNAEGFERASLQAFQRVSEWKQ